MHFFNNYDSYGFQVSYDRTHVYRILVRLLRELRKICHSFKNRDTIREVLANVGKVFPQFPTNMPRFWPAPMSPRAAPVGKSAAPVTGMSSSL